jgi:hypothetical protein
MATEHLATLEALVNARMDKTLCYLISGHRGTGFYDLPSARRHGEKFYKIFSKMAFDS